VGKTEDDKKRLRASWTVHVSTPAPYHLHSVRAVAERLGICAGGVYRLIAAGRLIAVKIGRSTRIPEASVAELVATLPEAAIKRVASE
jgi:excisionase family DNA binding protein